MNYPSLRCPVHVHLRTILRCVSRSVLRASCLTAVLLLPAIDALAGSLNLSLRDQDGQPVNDAVLYVSHVDGSVPASTPLDVSVDQVDETFVPHVRATTVGSRVSFPNSDHIRHHVYSFSETKSFEVPLYIGIPADPIVFDKAGLVTLGCNIHDHMLGYILVLDTPWFAEVTGGSAVLEGLPAGELQVALWHPRQATALPVQTLQATADGTLQLELQLELRPERMVRRAPRRSAPRY